jgi:3-methylcrotonyl-CoA carboxylase alpha subunit
VFDKILIANRGEIACRVAMTAKRLGIRTVAVYSDADAGSRHVSLCDEAFHVGPAPARDSYLRGDEIIRIMKACGAQAVHPGYGFLSENEGFAQACADSGLVFIGPPPAAIRAMGLKAESKRLMASAGVPLVPGYHEPDQDPARLQREADRIGYPVLIKASAGGGGKGMRIVESADAFAANLASCKREAAAGFGNDAVLIERYVTKPRHVEIQVFADQGGGCVYLFERDCSVQRRHQKVIEEAPAPGMTEARRRAMGQAAVAAARAVGYVGAGTVEFIVDAGGEFFFMEMNTRLQVEHPVTEMITGFDLVEWQLRVACGEPLPVQQSALAIDGHAIEARIYAENPEKGFLPSTGMLKHLALPAAVEFTVWADGTAAGGKTRVRVDAGVRQGDAITPHYDPMIAKLIVWGEDRATARRTMSKALAGLQVVGPATNVDFLRRLMINPAFADADLDTGLIERERAALLPPPQAASDADLLLAAAAVLGNESGGSDPWAVRNGWRIGAPLQRRLVFVDSSGRREVVLTYRKDGVLAEPAAAQESPPSGDAAASTPAMLALRTASAGSAGSAAGSARPGAPADPVQVSLQYAGEQHQATPVFEDETLHLFTASRHLRLEYIDTLAHAGEAAEEGGRLTAPMPGKIISILVQAGAAVSKGDPLLVMEAMKMEHTITAPADGTIALIHYAVGDQVAEGESLVAIE